MGSQATGFVWADTNRDGTRDTGEPLRSGVTVQLPSLPGGAVVATTTTNASGVYNFANMADGAYTVRVDAPHRITPINEGSHDHRYTSSKGLTGLIAAG